MVETRFIAFENSTIKEVDDFELLRESVTTPMTDKGMVYWKDEKTWIWFNGTVYGPYENERFKGKFVSARGRRLIFAYAGSDGDYVMVDGKKQGPIQ